MIDKSKYNLKTKEHIAHKLVATALFTTLIVAFAFVLFEIYHVNKQERSNALGIFNQIEQSYIQSLKTQLWEVNHAGINNLLNGIADLPNVGTVTLTDEQSNIFRRLPQPDDLFAKKSFVLIYTEFNQSFKLGELVIELTNANIKSTSLERARGAAIIIVLSLIANSAILLFLLHRFVISHLIQISRFVSSHFSNDLTTELTLSRYKHLKSPGKDELDAVVNSINNFRANLSEELNKRQAVEDELIAYKNNLEKLVHERTLAYQSSLAQLETAAKVAQLGIWTWNTAESNLTYNDRLLDIYDIQCNKFHEFMEQIIQRFHPEDRQRIEQNFHEFRRTGNSYEDEYRIITPDNHTKYVHVIGQKIFSSADNVDLLIGVTRDISDQKFLEQNLRHAKEQADAASAAKTNFLANMSHEIRTPMNAVLGMLVLLDRTTLDTKQKDYLLKAHSAAKSLLALINDLLDYTKIEAGKLTLEHQEFNLCELLDNLGVILSGNVSNKNIDVLFNIDANIPNLFVGDQYRLNQILINLAGNALKFTHEGFVEIKISAIAQTTSHIELLFSIEDSGIGISQEQLQHIFEAFSQAEASTTRRFGGSGLGLTITRQLIELMGGELTVNSEPQKGSCFSFSVNLALTAQTALIKDIYKNRHISTEETNKILIVDDNSKSVSVLSALCTSINLELDIEPSLVRGLAKLNHIQKAYRALVLDGDNTNFPEQLRVFLKTLSNKIDYLPTIIVTAANGLLLTEQLNNQITQSTYPIIVLTRPITPLQWFDAFVGQVRTQQVIEFKSNNCRLAGLNILVVEDNPINSEVARELLEAEGATVSLAEDGQAGVDAVFNALRPFDLVLMDIQMPRVDGYEAVRQIRINPLYQTLPIIAMTANVAEQDRNNCLAAGMNDHIGKPIEIDIIIKTVDKYVTHAPSPQHVH